MAYKGVHVGMSSSSQGLWTPNLTKRQSLRPGRRIRAVSKKLAPHLRSTLKHGPTFHPLSSNMLGELRGDQTGRYLKLSRAQAGCQGHSLAIALLLESGKSPASQQKEQTHLGGGAASFQGLQALFHV